jgi:hypothetical protein
MCFNFVPEMYSCSTIVFCGAQLLPDDMKTCITKLAMFFHSIINDGRLLAGAGAVEIE